MGRASCLQLLIGFIVCGAAGCDRRLHERHTDASPTASSRSREAPTISSAARPPPAGSDVVPSAEAIPSAPRLGAARCREQPPQDFLLRRHQLARPGASATERQAILAARKRAVDYRTRVYGHFPGFGSRRDNPHPPRHYARRTKFMGLTLVVHEKIIPALGCVEQALERDCALYPYRPEQVSGIRDRNTYKDYEVSNHVYGIAIDIDSHKNPCCFCVGRWREAPACRKKAQTPFDRMAMPKCWVEVFERHGFYWLGHDELEDTMHFEFLGDPAAIVES